MKLKPKSFFSLFFILFFLVVIIGALQYNPKARLIPLVVAIPCLAMSISQFILDFRKEKGKGRSIEDDLFQGVMERLIHQEVLVDDQEKEGKKSRGKMKGLLNISFWILLFSAFIFLFGFYITIPLFTILFIRSKGERWVLTLSCAAGLWLTVYLSFEIAARMSLYEGFVFRLLSGE